MICLPVTASGAAGVAATVATCGGFAEVTPVAVGAAGRVSPTEPGAIGVPGKGTAGGMSMPGLLPPPPVPPPPLAPAPAPPESSAVSRLSTAAYGSVASGVEPELLSAGVEEAPPDEVLSAGVVSVLSVVPVSLAAAAVELALLFS